MIRIERPTPSRLDALRVMTWRVWWKEPSTFDWTYDRRESFWILEGEATLRCYGQEVTVRAGDLVHVPAGVVVRWTVHRAVRKRYAFLRWKERLGARLRQLASVGRAPAPATVG